MSFTRSFNPIWYEVNLDGEQFDDTYYLYTLQNVLPYLPQPVYHTASGTEYSNPIQFLANGVLPTDIYFDASVVYRLEFRKNDGTAPPSQDDELVYLVESYTPSGSGSSDGLTIQTDNQVSNPQFPLVSFVSPLTLSSITDETIAIAPDWDIVLSGTGSVTVTRQSLTASDLVPTNAPYGLLIATSGFNSTGNYLRQRFNENGTIWSSSAVTDNKAVAVSITSRAADSISYPFTVRLVNNASSPESTTIVNETLTPAWQEYRGASYIPLSTNNTDPSTAYTELRISLPGSGSVAITSVQLVGQDLPIEVPYEQETVDRQIDHTFHYYKPQLAYKPIPSYTLGWDFPYNPAQATGTSVGNRTIAVPANGVAIDNRSFYVGDQTICFQSVANTMNFTFSHPGGFTAFTDSDTTFALVQYLPASTALELLSQPLASQIKGYVVSSGSQTTLPGQIRMYWTDDASLPDITATSYKSLVTAVAADGTPTIGNGTWNEIERSNLGTANFELNITTIPGGEIFKQQGESFSFNGWDATSSGTPQTTATFFAIVVSFGTLDATTDAVIRYCTLCAGDIASPPPAMNQAEINAGLEYYYETSYNFGVKPGTDVSATNVSRIFATQLAEKSGGNVSMFPRAFGFSYNSIKINPPALTFYTPSGTSGSVQGAVTITGGGGVTSGPAVIANWTSASVGEKNFYYQSANANPLVNVVGALQATSEAWLTYNIVLDSRLGTY